MPHKKSKRKTIPKHKKKGVKIIKNHKISVDTNKTETKYPFKIPQRKDAVIPTGLKANKQQIKPKRRLPVEVMPRVIDNSSETPEVKSTDSNDKSDIKTVNLTQAKKIREQVWIHHNGKKFETKCYVIWCTNMVDVFNFQVGHDTPKALGGSNTLLNLKPICQNCNQSMGSRYSIAEWNQLFAMQQRRQISTSCKTLQKNNLDYELHEKIVLTNPKIEAQLNDKTLYIDSNFRLNKMNYGPLSRLMPYVNYTNKVSNPNVRSMSILCSVVAIGIWIPFALGL